MLFKSYAKDNFDLVDADDPVFRNGSLIVVFDPGIGVSAQINDKLTFAASLAHLTRPNVALGDELDNVSFQGQLVLRGAAALFYNFNLPTSDLGLINAGSHEVGFVYTFPSSP